MKHIQIILGLVLFASVTTFAQSPRIKLNQITKDTVKGSVLISSPSDSGMVYSRDFYIAYGADTVLILYGDTLASTSGIISSVLSDGVTVTGDGTTGNELKVDTSLIATLTALTDSLATVPTKTTPDSVTITGDGSVGNPLKVDTATVVSTIQGLVDSLLTKLDVDFGNVTGTLPVANGGTGATSLSGANIVTGSGTANSLPKFTSSSEIGNSLLKDDGSLVQINSTNSTVLRLGTSTGGLYVIQDFYTNDSQTAYFQAYDNGSSIRIFDIAANSNINLRLFGTTQQFSTGGSERMRITNSGNVGINETGPSEKLDVNGKVKIQDLTGTGGNAVYENGGVLGVASDARFKTYIGDIVNGIELINQLKPKYFIDNRNSSFQQLGFYAQEVKSVINEASYPIGNTDYLGINDRAILATSVKAIQEQQAIIETQQTEIDQLKTIITDLTNRLIILENK